MFEYIEVGGIFMWPIFFLSVLGVAVLLEKGVYFLFIEIDATSSFKIKLCNLILEGDYEKIKEFCKRYKNSLAKTALFVAQNLGEGASKTQIDYIAEEAVSM